MQTMAGVHPNHSGEYGRGWFRQKTQTTRLGDRDYDLGEN